MSRSARLIRVRTRSVPTLALILAVVTATATALAPTGAASPASASPTSSSSENARTAGPARTGLTNAQFEAKLLALTNAHRKKVRCPAMRANPALTRAARAHTARMAAAQNLSHQLPGEPGLARRITQAGYKNWTAAAENIAWGPTSPAGVFRLWMRSTGHRANIERCVYRDAGFGVTVRSGQPWVTLVLARRR